MTTRRNFIKYTLALGAGMFLTAKIDPARVFASPEQAASAGRRLIRRAARRLEALPGGTLDPESVDKYQMQLVIPPAMPSAGRTRATKGANPDYYQIAMRQFQQQILPTGLPKTTVWSYGSITAPGTPFDLVPGTFHYPAFTIEAKVTRPVRVQWINDLTDDNGDPLAHLLPVDQTLHWANPPGPRDNHGESHEPYTGAVPMVTHLHGAHVTDESDGYTEAWYLPKSASENYNEGTWYDYFKGQFKTKYGEEWEPGTATFQYPNTQRPTTLWYHDHSLGMTRLNVYAGPAGFYLLRGGPDDITGNQLPGPAPTVGSDPFGRFYEIPLAIQDRSFNIDGSLFYPDNRAFFEGLAPEDLKIPFWGDDACGDPPDNASDVAPIWNPEFFGNTMLVNGRTWPYLEVEQRRYRFRILNGCNSRTLKLSMDNGMPFYQIGAEGGFLPAPVQLDQLLMGPAERADVIVDFTNIDVDTEIILLNLGPDEPFNGGGQEPADPATTGQVMQFRVVPATSFDNSKSPMDLVLPKRTPLPGATNTRGVTLNEEESATVMVLVNAEGEWVTPVELACGDPNAVPFGPTAALLGTESGGPLKWMDDVTEAPDLGATEVWEIRNNTVDAHPIHLHQVEFEVVNRQIASDGSPHYTGEEGGEIGDTLGPEAWETGTKDTVIAYPGEITRIKARFDLPGRYVWHCHIVEHEDNEMMRPFNVGEFEVGPMPPTPPS
jgi:FtsP/CotA-like multicopper oxidase with cupredoxin domain